MKRQADRHLRTPKRPRDPNQLAKMIVDIATGDVSELPAKNAAAQDRGRSGGQARSAKIGPERRSEIARDAAAKRWAKP